MIDVPPFFPDFVTRHLYFKHLFMLTFFATFINIDMRKFRNKVDYIGTTLSIKAWFYCCCGWLCTLMCFRCVFAVADSGIFWRE